ncbi:rod shape-determining protein MreC [Providencia alcalifaciens]|uniref:rod shape-determining protein MreC n=1 Tax=Providencia alcalifaciens TaxID=126385 RepID=UPI001CC60468|nr:rod shape-determining protein MreC [Providencia alcalifaciens]CAG9429061.1 Cell shape-determining protein MreC [Providencia alcalifaciens]
MKPIFRRGPSLQLRIFIAVIIALVLVVIDHRFEPFNKIRNYLDTAVSPFYFLANGPRQFLDNISDTLSTREQLQFENKALRQELLLKKADNLLLEQLKQENARLRELLGSPLRQDEHMMVTQVISGANTPYRDQVVIDKGSNDGVYEGQPVISDKGVVGQVVGTSNFNSRVLLICDTAHALPVQVLRNDIRVIAAGSGCADDLQLEPLPGNTDIRVGDVLVTSGLGGRFPEGYPVAVVSAVKHDTQRAYTIISARPSAELQRLRYLLLLWGNESDPKTPLQPSDVYRAANERLMKVLPQVLPTPSEIQGPPLPPSMQPAQPQPQP